MSDEPEVLDVLASHARLLERHQLTIDELRSEMKGIRAAIDAVLSAQRETNQLVAGIHTLWARLNCVRPGGRPPSSELRAVGCDGEEP